MFLQKAVASRGSNLARLGELGGKLLPDFPINRGRSEVVGVEVAVSKSDSSDIESNEGGFESRSENDNEGVGFEDSEEERVTGVNDGFDGEDEDLVNLILEKK